MDICDIINVLQVVIKEIYDSIFSSMLILMLFENITRDPFIFFNTYFTSHI